MDAHDARVVSAERNPLISFIADRTVRTKILMIVATLSLLSVGIGVLSATRLANMNDRLDTVNQVNIKSLNHLNTMRGGMSSMYNATIGLSAYYWAPPETKPTFETMNEASKKQVATADKTIDDAIAALRVSAASSPRMQRDLKSLATDMKAYREFRAFCFYGAPSPPGVDVNDTSYAFNLEKRITTNIEDLVQVERAASDQAVAAGKREYQRDLWWLVGILVVGLALAVLLALAVARLITQSVRQVSTALRATAVGDLTQTLAVRSRDELGEMADALNRANDGLRHTVSTLKTEADTLAERSATLFTISDRIAGSASMTNTQAANVSETATRVSENVRAVSAGATEMESSIQEIARNAEASAKVAAKAVDVVQSTTETVGRLGSSSAEIGSVIQVITSIAEQTNLLALNATIEAARAGDSGKGFAVVAGEVKDLAQETAKATTDIALQIEAIQADTGAAVAAIAEINDIITGINEYQVTIASAVEEQASTTKEISRSVTLAAEGVTDVARSITDIATNANTTADEVGQARDAADQLNRISEELGDLIGHFRC